MERCAITVASRFVRSSMSRTSSCRGTSDRDDDVAALVSPVDVAVSFDDLFERIPAINHRAQSPSFDQFPKLGEVVRSFGWEPAGEDGLAGRQRGPLHV